MEASRRAKAKKKKKKKNTLSAIKCEGFAYCVFINYSHKVLH